MESSENTKDFILKTAISLFAERGYDSIGVQEICTKANVTKPTLYYYFGSKAGLLQSIVDNYANELCNKICDAAIYKHDFQNSLTLLYKTVIQFAKKNRDLFSLHCILSSAPDGSEAKNIYSPINNRIDSALLDFFKNSSNEFGNMRGKEKLYGILFYNNLISVAIGTIQGRIKAGDECIYQIVHSFLYGIAN